MPINHRKTKRIKKRKKRTRTPKKTKKSGTSTKRRKIQKSSRKSSRRTPRKIIQYNTNNTNNINNNSNKDLFISSYNSSFNENPYIRESHNCYMYFLNKKNDEVVKICKNDYPKYKMCRRAQPGYASGFKILEKDDYKCPKIMKRTLKDNPDIYKTNFQKKCKPTHYKGALVVAPHRDYHYYRLNDDGLWTHKPGYKPSTTMDSNNNFIVNPKKAARDYGGTLNYKDFCDFLCVPREQTRKRMSHLNSRTQQGGKKKNTVKKTQNTKHKTQNTKLKLKIRKNRT